MPTLSVDDLQILGQGVSRPEGIAISRTGDVWVSDKATAVARVQPGELHQIGKAGGEPNGLNFLPSGEIVIANYDGHLQLIDVESGEVTSYVEEVDGRRIIHANYALADANGFVWATESTRIANSSFETMEQQRAASDGWIFVRRPDGSTEIVADGLGFANGLCLSLDGRWLYVAETLAGRIRRAQIKPGGGLGPVEDFFEFAPDGFEDKAYGISGPDGIMFDENDDLWVCVYNRNMVATISPDRVMTPVVVDPSGSTLSIPTNVAFGGPDRRTVYIGSITLPHVLTAQVPVAGAPQPYLVTTPAGG